MSWEVLFYVIFWNLIILFIVYQILWIRFKDVEIQQQQQQNRCNYSSYSWNNSNQSGNKSPVNNHNIQIIGTRPALNLEKSPISTNIFFSQADQ